MSIQPEQHIAPTSYGVKEPNRTVRQFRWTLAYECDYKYCKNLGDLEDELRYYTTNNKRSLDNSDPEYYLCGLQT